MCLVRVMFCVVRVVLNMSLWAELVPTSVLQVVLFASVVEQSSVSRYSCHVSCCLCVILLCI